jgi:hypothetical protein
MKLTFTCQHDDNSRNTLETHSIALPDILSDFEMFLRGSGFHFDGDVAIVNDDAPPWDPLQEILLQEADDPWTKIVNRHEEELEQQYLNSVFGSSDHLCPVCKLSRKTMEGHKCWDENCPITECGK